MTVAGIFCADYHSLYKPYIYRQVNSFRRIDPVVCTWSKSETHTSNAVVTSFDTDWGESRFPRFFSRICARLGISLSGGTKSEHAEVNSFIDHHSMDVAVAHTGFVADRIFEPVLSRGIPLVVYLHGGDLREAMHSWGWRKRLSHICRAAHEVVVVGKYMVDQVKGLGVDQSRISVIPVSAPVRDRNPESAFGEDNHFLFVGRLVPCKAVDVIIKAISMARTQGVDIRLSIIGDGPLAAELSETAQSLNVSDLIAFEGMQDSKYVNALLDRTSGLVIHTVDNPGGPEAFGVVVTEAMSAARPVIISKCGGLIDQITHEQQGCVVEQRDVKELCAAMIRLGADSELRKTYGKSARERALHEFDSHHLGVKVEDILIELTSSGAHS